LSLGNPLRKEESRKTKEALKALSMTTANNQRIDYSLIPQDCTDFYAALRKAGFPINNLIPEIVSDSNMSESFDYVISHLEHNDQRRKYRPKKDQYIKSLKEQIAGGTFKITQNDVREMIVDDGPKVRVVQAPRVYFRVGCHAVMVIVEKYVNPTLIENTAASIKGRGMHWLFHRIEEDYGNVPYDMQYFYKNDVEHYYDNISQPLMMREIRHYVSDPVLLPILDCFITILPTGLSKGLRSSQCFANLFLSPIDHIMCAYASKYTLKTTTADGETTEVTRYLYERYMDDTCIWGADKKRLWLLRDLHQQEMRKIGLRIKPSEAVRPITDGCDYLGFIFYGTHSRIRKRTKQKAARKLAKLKSRKRRQEIIGSFKGMACHADCKHLYYKLTHQTMKKFGEMGITYTPADGKKRFPGKAVRLGVVVNREIEVHDYEKDVTTKQGDGRYLVSFRDPKTGEWAKFFTASEEMKQILDKVSDVEDGFPFLTTIGSEVFDGNKVKYRFT